MFEISKAVEEYFKDCQRGCNNLISAEKLSELMKEDISKPFLLDIRKKEDYEKGHISEAYHTFWYEVGEIIDALPKDRKIVVICYTGQASGQVVALLKITGYDACSLSGGMLNGWSKLDFPLEEGCG